MSKIPILGQAQWLKRGSFVGAAVITLLGLAAAGAFFLKRIKDLHEVSARSQSRASFLEQRVGRLELQMEHVLVKQLPDGDAGAQVGGQGTTNAGSSKAEASIQLIRADIEVIRNYIKIPPPAAEARPTISLGMPVPHHSLVPLPIQVTERVPKLAGARFTTDRNGAIIIVTSSSGRADFIVPPN